MRTKNLTLRDIHVGDWVQVWSPAVERYTPPMKIKSIHDDGTIYLCIDEECSCEPWEEDIKNVDALPITEDVLKGFGFRVSPHTANDTTRLRTVYHQKEKIGAVHFSNDRIVFTIGLHRCYYMHELINCLYTRNINIQLEWKGVDKKKNSHEKV